jgi:hypothetical protein
VLTARLRSKRVAIWWKTTAWPGLGADRDPGSLGVFVSDPGSYPVAMRFCRLRETGYFGVVCVACVCLFGGRSPGGSVPGAMSVELAGAAIGGVLPSWLYVTLHV